MLEKAINLPNISPEMESPTENIGETDMRATVEKQLGDIKNKNAALETSKFISKNQLKQLKIKILHEIFSSLEKLGVDPNNLESINSFLQSLERQDPDLLKIFEIAISGLSPEVGNEVALEESPGLMGKYNNLQEQVLRGGTENALPNTASAGVVPKNIPAENIPPTNIPVK